jgi:hypothetical protein
VAVFSDKSQRLYNYFKQVFDPGDQPAHRLHPGSWS